MTNNSWNSQDPVQVAKGGTGLNTTTAYAPIVGGTTATGAFQAADTGIATSGFILTSNGNAAKPSFKTFSGITSVVEQVFTSDGTYTPTTGMLYCWIRIVGGGGGGGGAAITNASQWSGGSGGGAGEYAEGIYSAATIGASQVVSIGAAGAGNAGATGGTGGTTSVGAIITAIGGTGGVCIAAAATGTALGGIGGTGGAGGAFIVPGAAGMPCFFDLTSSSIKQSGKGGNSLLGAGGPGRAATALGGAGTGGGGGGAGSFNEISQAAATAGAVGAKGCVLIIEYVGT